MTQSPDWLTDALVFGARLAELDCTPSTLMFEVDGLLYTSTKWPAAQGLRIWPRLILLLGEDLLKSIATGEIGEIDFIVAAVRIAERAQGFDLLVKDLLCRMQCGQRRGKTDGGLVVEAFDTHFAGEYAHLLRVCALAIAHNLRGPTFGSQSSIGSQ